MWLEVAADLLMPKRDNEDIERAALARPSEKKLAVPFGRPGAFAQRLNESRLADEVVAGGVLAQGKTPSMLAMVTGAALVRRSPAPRLQGTPARVRACRDLRAGDRLRAERLFGGRRDRDCGGVHQARRARIVGPSGGPSRGGAPTGKAEDGVLELPGLEPMPVTWGNNSSTCELVKLLGR